MRNSGSDGRRALRPSTAKRSGTEDRSSGATAYLRPALKRGNLTVEVNAQATRILFEGQRATGIEYRQNGVTRTVRAAREVILAGGVINTPQLLILSGIGDPDDLRNLNVPVKSIDASEAPDHFGWLGGFVGLDLTASSAWTRRVLDWHPTGPSLMDDLEHMDYSRRD